MSDEQDKRIQAILNDDDFQPVSKEEHKKRQAKRLKARMSDAEKQRRREGVRECVARHRAKKKVKLTTEEAVQEKKKLSQIDKVATGKSNIIDSAAMETANEEFPDLIKDRQIGWQPFPGPQTYFLEADEFEVLFSGGRAPGKSDALMMDALRYCGHKEFRGLVIRKAMKELRDLIKRAKELYPMCYPGTKWKEQEKLFVFPSGATVEFGYCDHEEDVEQYKGQEYSWLGIDELTEIPSEETYERLIMSVRKKGKDFKTYVRATTNPNGAGKAWVKRRFVDRGQDNTTISIKTHIPQLNKTVQTTRKWIHGTVFDNPKIVAENPEYIAMLSGIDNAILRKQWLDGDWDSSDGLAFDEFDRKKHIIKPFEIPHDWHKFRACDWGYKTKAACLWFAVDYDGNLYVYREFTAGGQTPRGKMLAKEFGAAIREIEDDANEKVRYGILDASAWAQRGEDAPSPAEEMGYLNWRPSDRTKNSRISGKLQVHSALQLDESGEPRLKIFDTCLDLISCITSIPIDKRNPEDVDTNADDHAYDALRYGVMSRPSAYNNYGWEAQQSIQQQVIDPVFGF